VVVNYRGAREAAAAVVAEIEAASGRAVAVQADITLQEGVARLHQEAVRAFGPVGVLVNNASARINPKAFNTMAWEDFQQQLDVQLKGAFQLVQACLPAMTERRYGRIINITSQVVAGSPAPHWTSYAVAKAALGMMSRYLAGEFGPSGITVNCVAPGMTETALIGDIPEKAQMMIARQAPLRRLAYPDDVAGAVAFLASPAGAYITGQSLGVNGGASMP
jgi:3-oxoacyl-[acyl-carrier protein] reductase